MPGTDHDHAEASPLLITLDDQQENLTVAMPVQRHVEIYAETGRLVMYAGVSGLIQQLNIRQLADGRYMMKAGIYSGRFTICRKPGASQQPLVK